MAVRKKKAEPKAESASPEVKAKKSTEDSQPQVSIGMVGHVDHGKTTLVRALSGKWADTHSEEMRRGITIKLGYADFSIFKKKDGVLTTEEESDGVKNELVRRCSLVDAPGHESLMATMLSGANIMDGAFLLISAQEDCPQPQTREHVHALSIMGIKNVVVVQNKVDLVPKEQAKRNYEQIKEFLKDTEFKDAPIVPISAMHKLNIDVLLQAVEDNIPTPERDPASTPLMFVARSFDVNRPGSTPDKMTGGVLGGAIKQGAFEVGMDIEILPGYEVEERNQKVWYPLRTKVTSIMAGGKSVKAAHPGGSVAVMTDLDPSVVKGDKLVGHLVGPPGSLPKVLNALTLEPHLLERMVGAKDDLLVKEIHQTEILMLNVNSAATVGVVTDTSKKLIKLALKRPVCAAPGSRVTISRNLEKRWRLIGYGIII